MPRRFYVCMLVTIWLTAGCAREPAPVNGKSGFQGQTLNLFNWSDYLDEKLIAEFEKRTGARVNYDKFTTDADLEAKIIVTGASYDLIFPSDRSMTPLVKKNVLAEIDQSKLSNWKNLDAKFLKPRFDPENRYSVPYFWGTLAVGIRSDHVKEPVQGFAVLFDERYKGKIAMLDDAENVVAMAMLHLGYPMNSLDDAHLAKAQDLLVKQAPLVRSYTSDGFKEKLLKGEAWVVLGWSGDILQACEENEAIRAIVPETGTMIYVDSMAIPKTAKNPALAHAFIDFLLEPAIAARNANTVKYASPNVPARALVDAKLLQDPAIYPSAQVIDRCQWLQDRGGDIRKIERLWRAIPKG